MHGVSRASMAMLQGLVADGWLLTTMHHGPNSDADRNMTFVRGNDVLGVSVVYLAGPNDPEPETNGTHL